MEARQFTTIEQARAWVVEQFGRWATRPTPAHLQALLAYKSNGFRLINRALRDDSATRFDAPLHLAITEAIAAEAITEAVQVYRGISDPQIVELVQLQAEQIDHKGFASVSLLHRVATDFGTDTPVGVVLVAVLPIGTQAAPLDLIPGAPFASEAELLLLHAGAAFVIDEVNDEDPRLIIARGHWRFPRPPVQIPHARVLFLKVPRRPPGDPMTQPNTSSGRERLITTTETGGVTVRLRPQGIADLIAAGNGGEIERVQRLLPRLDEEQRPLVIAGLSDQARALLGQPAPRRRGQPAGPSAKTSPVAIVRGHDQVTQAELGRRLGKGDSAVRNAEKRGFDIGLNTLAEYAQGVGATVDVVIRHADGTEERIPVPGTQAA